MSSSTKNFSISIDQNEDGIVDVRVSNQHDFRLDSSFDELVKKVETVFDTIN